MTSNNLTLIPDLEDFKMSTIMLKSDEEIKTIIRKWITNEMDYQFFSFKSNTSNIEIYDRKLFLTTPSGQEFDHQIFTVNIEIHKDITNSIIFWKLTSDEPLFVTKKSLTSTFNWCKLPIFDGFISKSSIIHTIDLSNKCPYLGGSFPYTKTSTSNSPFTLSYNCLSPGDIVMNTSFMIYNGEPLYDNIRDSQIIKYI